MACNFGGTADLPVEPASECTFVRFAGYLESGRIAIMKGIGHHPISLTELVEQLLAVYAGKSTRNAATPSAPAVTLATQRFLDAFSER